MSRRKKPVGETLDETTLRVIREEISNIANRSEKTSWNRKMDNMVRLLAEIKPIEDQIIDLQEKKIPIFDEIQRLRKEMVRDCVHPYEYLLVESDRVICKFCERKLSLPDPEKM
jgi:predicted  nucleic acid-binding Zn-ribbon protein